MTYKERFNNTRKFNKVPRLYAAALRGASGPVTPISVDYSTARREIYTKRNKKRSAYHYKLRLKSNLCVDTVSLLVRTSNKTASTGGVETANLANLLDEPESAIRALRNSRRI